MGVNQTLANQAVTLAFLRPSAKKGFKLLKAWVGFAANTTAARQRVQLVAQASVFPTLVAAAPGRMRQADDISDLVGGTDGSPGTAGINASAEGAGTKTVLWADAFDVLQGWRWDARAGEEIVFPANSPLGLGLHFPAAPGTLTGWSFGLLFREMGA
jgi:hypothetical protein